MQLLLDARPLIERLSGDRIRHELNPNSGFEHRATGYQPFTRS